MASDATSILFDISGGGSEPAPGQPGLFFVYFPPVDVGTFRAQVRLTCRITNKIPGRVEVEVVETNPGIKDNATGKVEYQADASELIETSTVVVMRWRQLANGIRVSHQASQHFLLKLPGWFPVPDGMVEAVVRPFVETSISTSQTAVIERFARRLKLPQGKL